MADDDYVNRKQTDASTQVAVRVLGDAPAHSLAVLYQAMAATVATSMQNATAAQQAMQQVNTAVVSTACARILSLVGAGGAAAPPGVASPGAAPVSGQPFSPPGAGPSTGPSPSPPAAQSPDSGHSSQEVPDPSHPRNPFATRGPR